MDFDWRNPGFRAILRPAHYPRDKFTPALREPLRGYPADSDGMQQPFRLKRRAQGRRQERQVRHDPGLTQQQFQVAVPQDGGRHVEPVVDGLIGGPGELAEFQDPVDAFRAHGDQPVQGRSSRTKRRRAEHETALEVSLRVAEQCHHQTGAAAEPPEDRALADTRALCHRVHGEAARAGFLDNRAGSAQQEFAVPCRIAAFCLGTRRDAIRCALQRNGPGAARRSGAEWGEAHTAYCSPGE